MDTQKSKKGLYHYEYFVYTDNLCWGRMFLGQSRSKPEARRIASSAGRGCCKIERRRVYHPQS